MSHKNTETPNTAPTEGTEVEQTSQDRADYQAPKVTKKKSVASVTLFSGGGATAGGLTAAG